VKIKGTCKRDGREFLIEQVIASGGRCPWDGEPFTADYAATLVDALRDAVAASAVLEESLTKVADIRPEFTLQAETVLADLRTQLTRLEQNLVKRG
jgi:hypothetical protein